MRNRRLPEMESKSADPSDTPTLQARAEQSAPEGSEEHANDRPTPAENDGFGAALASKASPRALSVAASAKIRSRPCSRKRRSASAARRWVGRSKSPSGSRACAGEAEITTAAAARARQTMSLARLDEGNITGIRFLALVENRHLSAFIPCVTVAH